MPSARSLTFALATITAFVLAACGGSSPTGPGAPGGPGSRGYVVPSPDTISTDNAPSVARYPAGRANDEVSEAGKAPMNPCRLVSRREASEILGATVQVSLGLQGPTCIYAAQGLREEVTLLVGRARLASLRRQATRALRMRIEGRSAWCIRYGSASVVMPLNDGRVLSVAGPCDVAAHFAARALRRLG